MRRSRMRSSARLSSPSTTPFVDSHPGTCCGGRVEAQNELVGVRSVPRAVLDRPRVRDGLLVLVATGASLAIMGASPEGGARDLDAPGVMLVALAGGLLLARRRWPVTVLLAVLAVTYLALVAGYSGGSELPLQMAALYSAMAWGRRTRTLAIFAVVVVWSSSFQLFVDGVDPVLVGFGISLLGLVVLLGEAVRTRELLREESVQRLRALKAEQEFETRAQLTSERLRVARELHDVLAHTLTAISVHAAASADGLEEGSDGRAALRSVRRTAQEAMWQLKATIEILRAEHEPEVPFEPPDLSALEQLLEGMQRAGLDVAIHVGGEQRRLSAAVELTAYRIIQESLTNVMRHADSDTVGVSLQYGLDELTVEVVDDGRRSPAPGQRGHGIIGMRERVQSVGGQLHASPCPEGGFRVKATLPARGDS